MHLEHKHFVVKADVTQSPLLQDLKFIEDWMRRLIRDVGMVILIEPQVAYCDQENNRGVTAIAALTTSSCSLHIWDEVSPPFVQFDLYSCKNFEVDTVLNAINEFGMTRYEYYFIDREIFEHTHVKS